MSLDQICKVSHRSQPPYQQVLTANRSLGIRTVAIYSESDGASLHVMLADKACLLAGDARSAYIDG